MRVAFVSWRDLAHPLAGGSEVAIDHLARGLSERGHEVALMCGGPLARHEYETVDLGGTYAQYLRAPFVHAKRFRDWDVVVDVQNGVPYFSPLWRRGPSVCLVHHVHTEQWSTRFGPVVAAVGRTLERSVMPLVYRRRLFVAVSESTARALEGIGVPRSHIRVIHWGMDLPPGDPAPRSETPQFLTLGRLVPHKRIDLLLRAWERVRLVTGGRLVIAGDGPERARLERNAGVDVEFVGAVSESEKWQLLQQSWFLVHPAAHEGWGVVVFEAAGAGTPALGFDVPGVRESVVDGVTGILATSEDDFVAQWVELAADPARQRRFGRAASGRAEEFTWDRTVDEMLLIAREAMATPALVER